MMSTSPDRWSSVAVKGQAPPPIYDFTLTTVGANKAAMFGGLTESTTRSDDLFIVELGKHTVVSAMYTMNDHTGYKSNVPC